MKIEILSFRKMCNMETHKNNVYYHGSRPSHFYQNPTVKRIIYVLCKS